MGTHWLSIFNAFIEDTCVVVTVAWGLTRTKTLAVFFGGTSFEERTILGLLFGVLATSEVIFPGARSPYVFHTLLIGLAQFVGGAEMALVAIVIVVFASLGLHGFADAIQTLIILVSVGLIVESVRRWKREPASTVVVGVTGGVVQAIAVSMRNVWFPSIGFAKLAPYHLTSIVANAFGLFLIMLVWKDAQTRALSERNRLDAEHSRTLLVSADLAALKARIRPHFLFNALAAIAALCDIDPKRAQTSTLKMAQLMRRHIEVDSRGLIRIEKELEYVRTYIEIQETRFGKRASVHLEVEGDLSAFGVPSFSLQTLVENAFQHGVERRTGRGEVKILVKCKRKCAILAVQDDGLGMEADQVAACVSPIDPPTHGLSIADQQLRLLFGNQSRMRIFSRPGKGTVVAFRVGEMNQTRENEVAN